MSSARVKHEQQGQQCSQIVVGTVSSCKIANVAIVVFVFEDLEAGRNRLPTQQSGRIGAPIPMANQRTTKIILNKK